jgi:hypothetical protein
MILKNFIPKYVGKISCKSVSFSGYVTLEEKIFK